MRSLPRLLLAPACLLLAGCSPSTDDQPGDRAGDRDDAAADVYQPEIGVTWQWQLSGKIDTTVDAAVFDVDLFETADGELAELRDRGRKVICYFSAGSYEPGRPDAAAFPEEDLGSELDGWPGERWLDIRSEAVRNVMTARLDLARERGCDAVEPDNVDGYDNESGFDLEPEDQLDFNRFLAREAHDRGLSIGLKNDIGQLAELADDFDWALNEECFTYDECDAYAGSFIARGKAVLHAEYVSEDRLDDVCEKTRPLGLSTLVKNLDLDAWSATCPP